MTSYTYTTGIPNPTDTPAQDVSNLQVNTNSAASIWTTDHVGFNSQGPTKTGSGGQHLQVSFNGNNVPAFPATFPTLYVNTQDGNGHSLPNNVAELFFVSGASSISQSQYLTQSNGSTFLFGGIIIKWGSNAVTNSSQNFPIAFPNNAFAMLVTSTDSALSSPLKVTALSSSSYTVTRSGSGNTGYYYIAIGN